MLLFLQFTVCSILILIAGHFVSKYGHVIAKKMNWHDGFIGVLFLAFATSMPEVFTSISSVPQIFAIAKINMGFGDIIGSLLVNLILLSFLDFWLGKGKILIRVSKEHIQTGVYTLILLAILGVFSFLRRKYSMDRLAFFNTGIESFLIVGVYYWGMNRISQNRHNKSKEEAFYADNDGWGKFLLLLVVIFLLGVWLAHIGNRIAVSTSINQNFVGTFFLAVSTSLPELAVSLSALRMGLVNMSVGNILGSNFFDICIIPAMDVVYRRGPLLKDIAAVNIFTTLLVFVMTCIIIAGISYGPKCKTGRTWWASISVFTLGLFGLFVVYKFG